LWLANFKETINVLEDAHHGFALRQLRMDLVFIVLWMCTVVNNTVHIKVQIV